MTQIDLFFNTTHEANPQLEEHLQDALNQNEIILGIFITNPNTSFTPFEIHTLYCSKYPTCPETSIRRAITTLTKQGKLIKTDTKKKEKYNRNNYLWKLNDNVPTN